MFYLRNKKTSLNRGFDKETGGEILHLTKCLLVINMTVMKRWHNVTAPLQSQIQNIMRIQSIFNECSVSNILWALWLVPERIHHFIHNKISGTNLRKFLDQVQLEITPVQFKESPVRGIEDRKQGEFKFGPTD